MRQATRADRVTVEDYIEGEKGADVRHEYVGGRVYAMTGASRAHNIISVNLTAALAAVSRAKGCQLFANDMKVHLRIAGDDIFYYPDILVTCDAADLEDDYTTAPCLIVEVLSPNTERTDRREKYLAYRELPSLDTYVLVAQDRRRVEAFRRANDWQPEGRDDGVLRLDCLDTQLSLATIYEGVTLHPEPETRRAG